MSFWLQETTSPRTTFSEAIQLRPRFFNRPKPNPILICPSSIVCVGGCCPVSPAFDSLWWTPFVLAAFRDHPTLQQRGDDLALIFIEQASDIGHVEPVVEKEVANRNASLGLGIEIHAVSRHVKFSLTHLEAIASFTVSLFHFDTFEKRPKFHGNQKRERIAFLSTAARGTFTDEFRTFRNFSGCACLRNCQALPHKGGCDYFVNGLGEVRGVGRETWSAANSSSQTWPSC
jgi:hypothetical protein